MTHPSLGYRPRRKGEARLLMVCWFDPTGISTVCENVALWQRFSRFEIEVLNLWPGRGGGLMIPATVDLQDYAGVIIHCTTAYSFANLSGLDAALARPFEQYDGLKILMKQDEQCQVGGFARYLADKKFDLALTCVSAEERDKVYPPDVVGEVQFLQTLTGYVSPLLRSLEQRSRTDRHVDIAYRGSLQPLEFGRLGFEKRKIGYDVTREIGRPDLHLDISSRWEERISGTAWFDFLAGSKAVLGTESGSDLFDFTGEVAAWCRDFERRHGILGFGQTEEQYLLAHAEYLHRFEGNVAYAQMSPRHFEAAATRSLQILYEGSYSGIFIANRHFVPLRRDLSNLPQVLDVLANEHDRAGLTECAYEEVIQNSEYWYEGFVARFDQAAEQALSRKGKHTRGHVAAARRPRALLLVGHEPLADPRVGWLAGSLAKDFEVCELGTHGLANKGVGPTQERVSDHHVRVRIEHEQLDWDWVPGGAAVDAAGSVGLQLLLRLYVLTELPSRSLARVLGALDADEADLSRFRWLARYFVMTSGALLQAARLIGDFDVIVAVDMPTLPAALVLGRESGARVVYDAHEWWPHSIIEFRHWEVAFWTAVDRELSQQASVRITVSPPLARRMTQEYGCDFVCAPNWATLEQGTDIDLEAALATHEKRKEVIFTFVGGFAPGRGLEDLVTAWASVDERAVLWLRGPDNSYKATLVERARSAGLLDNRIVFPPAVSEDALIRAAGEADIGIIPYSPSNIIYRLACPNKLSQYMAAGLPILCSEMEYVRQVVSENQIGLAVDFADHNALAHAVNDLAASRTQIAVMSRKSRQAFLSDFNWAMASKAAIEQVHALIADRPWAARSPLKFDWIEARREMVTGAAELGSAVSLFPQERLAAETEIKRLNTVYPEQINLLNSIIKHLNTIYPEEIARLNEVYTEEIARLNEVYTAEIAHLNEVYPAEIARLDDVHSAEIARLNEVYPAEITRLNEVYPAEVARLNNVVVELNTSYSAEIARLTDEIARINSVYWIKAARLIKAHFRSSDRFLRDMFRRLRELPSVLFAARR